MELVVVHPHRQYCEQTIKLMGMLYCQFYQWSELRTLLQLYVSSIRPHAAPVWDPHLSKDILRIEGAQKLALRVCLKDWDSSYHNLLEESDLNKLSVRRNHLSLCHFSRIIQEQCSFRCPTQSLPQVIILVPRT